MSINNLKIISDFSKQNNNFSDFNLVTDLFMNLNFTKYRTNKIQSRQFGGESQQLQVPPELMQGSISGMIPGVISDPIVTGSFDNPMGNPMMSNPMMGNPMMGNPMMGNPMMGNPMSNQMMDSPPTGLMTETQSGKKCREEMIPRPDGSFIKREICDNYMATFPNMYLAKPNFVSGEIKTYTIPKGTVLYHSVDGKRGFNTNDIQLGNGSNIIFFTPNFRLASDKIQGCSIDKQKGYIHSFEVIQDIPNIFIKLPYDTSEDVSVETLKSEFCNGTGQYNGVGFFYPKNEIELFNKTILSSESIITNLTEDYFFSEFGLCNPTPYIKYLYSQKCQSLRKLSQPYRFDKYGLD